MKNIANGITSLRIVFAAALLATVPFSRAFWICYLCGGLSDVLDGLAARTLGRQSEAGARFDSVADAVFACALAGVMLVNIAMPAWLWLCMLCVALLRLVCYGVGFWKYRTFSALHTYANKATGALIFAGPLLYKALGIAAAGGLLCAAALLSALEELVITVRSRELNRECRGLFDAKDALRNGKQRQN